MKKILVMSIGLDIGGVQRSLVSLLQVLSNQAYHIDLLLLNRGGELEKLVPDSVRIVMLSKEYRWIFMPRGEVLQSLQYSLGPNLNIFRLLFYMARGLITGNMGKARQQLFEASRHTLPPFKGSYDAALDYPGLFKAFLIHKVAAHRRLSWVHGDYKLLGRNKRIDSIDYDDIDAVVTVTESCMGMFQAEFPQYKSKCFLMPNISLKSSIIEMSKEQTNFAHEYTGIKIMDITRLDYGKGLDIAVEACELLATRGYDVRWFVLGEGPARRSLEEKIRQKRLSQRFILLGNKANPYPYMNRADIIVHCSLNEGKSVAIDEAMLLAKPIILTDYPTAKDQITSGVNGIICDISAEGVAEAVQKLIENQAFREKLTDALVGYEISSDVSLSVFNEMIKNT